MARPPSRLLLPARSVDRYQKAVEAGSALKRALPPCTCITTCRRCCHRRTVQRRPSSRSSTPFVQPPLVSALFISPFFSQPILFQARCYTPHFSVRVNPGPAVTPRCGTAVPATTSGSSGGPTVVSVTSPQAGQFVQPQRQRSQCMSRAIQHSFMFACPLRPLLPTSAHRRGAHQRRQRCVHCSFGLSCTNASPLIFTHLYQHLPTCKQLRPRMQTAYFALSHARWRWVGGGKCAGINKPLRTEALCQLVSVAPCVAFSAPEESVRGGHVCGGTWMDGPFLAGSPFVFVLDSEHINFACSRRHPAPPAALESSLKPSH